MDLLKLVFTTPAALITLDYLEKVGEIILAVYANFKG